MKRRLVLVLVLLAFVLAAKVAWDFAVPGEHSLRRFDAHAVGRLETEMWRSYYDHKKAALFLELTDLLCKQYHLPFSRALTAAYHAARAAVVFQPGRNRAEYERALPDLIRFYSLIRQGSDVPF